MPKISISQIIKRRQRLKITSLLACLLLAFSLGQILLSKGSGTARAASSCDNVSKSCIFNENGVIATYVANGNSFVGYYVPNAGSTANLRFTIDSAYSLTIKGSVTITVTTAMILKDVNLDGATLVLNGGQQTFDNLTVINSGVVTHDAPIPGTDFTGDHEMTAEGKKKIVDLKINNRLLLSSGGKINVDGKGYSGGTGSHIDGYGICGGPGDTSSSHPWKNGAAGGSSESSRLGGAGAKNDGYAFTYPVCFQTDKGFYGSGGGYVRNTVHNAGMSKDAVAYGGAGGGAVKISARVVEISGVNSIISAKGNAGGSDSANILGIITEAYGGAGSGGIISISASEFLTHRQSDAPNVSGGRGTAIASELQNAADGFSNISNDYLTRIYANGGAPTEYGGGGAGGYTDIIVGYFNQTCVLENGWGIDSIPAECNGTRDVVIDGLTTYADKVRVDKTTGAMCSSDDGLAGHWTVNETSGSLLTDSSGNDRSASVSGTTIVDGKFGKARSFNGTTDYASVSKAALPLIADKITMTAWIKFVTAPTTPQTILSKNETGGYGVIADLDNSNRIESFIWAGDHYLRAGAPISSFALNTWHYIAVTYDGKNARFFQNGVLKETIAGSGKISNVDYDLLIGANPGPAGRADFFNGQIDEVRLYSRSITETEALNLFTRGDADDTNCDTKRTFKSFKLINNGKVTHKKIGANGTLINDFDISYSNCSGESGTYYSMTGCLIDYGTLRWHKVDINVAGDLILQNGEIDVSNSGYPSFGLLQSGYGQGGGKPYEAAGTPPGPGGGSFGGAGKNNSGSFGAVYPVGFSPLKSYDYIGASPYFDFGSGGGSLSSSNTGGVGGGRIHLKANKISLDKDSLILADGGDGYAASGGGGAGGMIWLEARTYAFPSHLPGVMIDGGKGDNGSTANAGETGYTYTDVYVPNLVSAMGGNALGVTSGGGGGGRIIVKSLAPLAAQPVIKKTLKPISRLVVGEYVDVENTDCVADMNDDVIDKKCFNPYALKIGDKIEVNIDFNGIVVQTTNPTLEDKILTTSDGAKYCDPYDLGGGSYDLVSKKITWILESTEQQGLRSYRCQVKEIN